jgi:hypothetical protein
MAETPADDTDADSGDGPARTWWHPTPTAWVLGTFNVVTLGLVLVVLGHRADALGALQGLGTLPGVLVFGYLWAVTVVVTDGLLVEDGRSRLDGSLGSFSLHTAAAGALIGMTFLVGLVVGAGAVTLVTSGEVVAVLLSALGVAPFLGIAAPIAGVVGALVGLLLGVLDLLLYRAAGVVVTGERAGQ